MEQENLQNILQMKTNNFTNLNEGAAAMSNQQQ